MNRHFGQWTVGIALLVASLHDSRADGGAVLAQQTAGAYQVTVFASPSPLRAGPTDFSVMIQDAKTGAPVLDRTVSIDVKSAPDSTSDAWVAPCCSMTSADGPVAATRANAQNKLLYAANVVLPAAGLHDIAVQIDGESGPKLNSQVEVLPPAPPAASYWPWLAAPPFLIGAFALNQRLRRRI